MEWVLVKKRSYSCGYSAGRSLRTHFIFTLSPIDNQDQGDVVVNTTRGLSDDDVESLAAYAASLN